MSRLFRPLRRVYGRWMHGWENKLCFRSTDRIVRPFDYGLEWSSAWPCTEGLSPDSFPDPASYITELSRRAVANSSQFYGYQTPADFRLKDSWLHFTSPVKTLFPANNEVRALWFPSKKKNG